MTLTAGRVEPSPLERAKQIMAGMVRSEKEQHWIGMRMENFQRAYERRIPALSVKDVCDYLESLMRRGQLDWQGKQSLDGIGLLMRYTVAKSWEFPNCEKRGDCG